MMDGRTLVPELLDDLPPSDPQAQGSRRDLARINTIMGNDRVVARMLGGRHLARVLEIGAGDGRFMLKVVRRLGPGMCATLLDRQALVTPELSTAFHRTGNRCQDVTADVFDYLGDRDLKPFDAIVANLFLHHFEGGQLERLLHLISTKTGLFVACEPRRSELALAGTKTLGLIGCNAVTRHDARVSVRAGFRGRELSILWPEGWNLEERAAVPFSHVFRAERKG